MSRPTPPSPAENDGLGLLRTATYLSMLIGRHSLAFAVTIISACLIWTLVYLALLLWAMFSAQGLGGPFSYPAGLLFAAVSSALACIVLFLPSTILAEWTAWRLRWPILLQIPISVVWLAILSIIAVIAFDWYTSTPVATSVLAEAPALNFEKVPRQAGLLILAMLLPMGLYWWTAQGPIAILALMSRVWHRVATSDASAPRSNSNYTSNRHRTHGYTPGESLVTKKAPKRADDE